MNGNRVHLPPEFDLLIDTRDKVMKLQGSHEALERQVHRVLTSQARRREGPTGKPERKSFLHRALAIFKLIWPFAALTIAVIRTLLSLYGKEAMAAKLEYLLSFMDGLKIE